MWLAQPVLADVAADSANDIATTPVEVADGRFETALLPHEREVPLRPLAVVAPAALIVALSALGLAITIRSLRDDLSQRRNMYRRRANKRSGGTLQTSN